jgi:MFS family permease
MPLYYEAVKGYTPIIAGVAVFPETFTTAPAAIAVGVSVSITGRYRWAIWLGWALTILGMGLLCLLGPDTTIVQWIFLNIIAGLGTGVLFPSLSYAIQGAIDNKDVSFGQAFYSFFRAFGQAIGIAIGGTIFQNTIKSKISTYDLLAPFADEYSQDATALVIIIQAMEEGLAKTQLIQAYSDSLRIIWVVMCVLAGVAGLTSMLTKEFTLDRKLHTKQGLRKELNSVDTEAREQGPVQEVKA